MTHDAEGLAAKVLKLYPYSKFSIDNAAAILGPPNTFRAAEIIAEVERQYANEPDGKSPNWKMIRAALFGHRRAKGVAKISHCTDAMWFMRDGKPAHAEAAEMFEATPSPTQDDWRAWRGYDDDFTAWRCQCCGGEFRARYRSFWLGSIGSVKAWRDMAAVVAKLNEAIEAGKFAFKAEDKAKVERAIRSRDQIAGVLERRRASIDTLKERIGELRTFGPITRDWVRDMTGILESDESAMRMAAPEPVAAELVPF
jgi:hypothetical protein